MRVSSLPGDDADVIELSKRDEARAHPAKGTTPFRDIKSRGVPLDPEDLTTEAQVLLLYMFNRGETELSVFADADPVRVTRPTRVGDAMQAADELSGLGLAENYGNNWRLTPDGTEAARRLRAEG